MDLWIRVVGAILVALRLGTQPLRTLLRVWAYLGRLP